MNKADAGDINAFMEYVGGELVWSLKLINKAGRGDDIEESDDIDKEIELFGRQIVSENRIINPRE